MLKNKTEVDAVDIVYTFGLEEQFNPPTILNSFLRESWKKPKKVSWGSASTLLSNQCGSVLVFLLNVGFLAE